MANFALDEYYQKAFNLILSGRAKKAFDLNDEPANLRDKYGRHTFGQSLLLGRRLIEAGTRFVQINWPAVANGNPLADVRVLTNPGKNLRLIMKDGIIYKNEL